MALAEAQHELTVAFWSGGGNLVTGLTEHALLLRIATFLPSAKDMLRLGLTCSPFATKCIDAPPASNGAAAAAVVAARPPEVWSIVQEAARRWLEGCSDQERGWVPRLGRESWLWLMREVETLRRAAQVLVRVTPLSKQAVFSAKTSGSTAAAKPFDEVYAQLHHALYQRRAKAHGGSDSATGWTPEIDEIIRAYARKGSSQKATMVQMLRTYATSLEMTEKITGSAAWLLNPTSIVCPFDGDKCKGGHRMVTGAPGKLCGLFGPQGHLARVHSKNEAACVLIARYQALQDQPGRSSAQLNARLTIITTTKNFLIASPSGHPPTLHLSHPFVFSISFIV